MPQFARRSALIVILVAWMATTAVADPGGPQNDAGSGGDAGNVRSLATPISGATPYTASLRPNDIDWYAASFNGTTASCVTTHAKAAAATYVAIGVETTGANLSVPMLVTPGADTMGGVAGMMPLTATLRAAPAANASNFGSYDFRVDRVGVPSVNGDGPTAGDAGDSLATAMAAGVGCTGGHLTVLGDSVDMYSIQVPAGQVVTYSLAANLGGINLGLLDSVGNAIGPVLDPGQSATVTTSGGTYYMSAVRAGAVGDVGYVIGAVIGPEPAGCKPYCLDS